MFCILLMTVGLGGCEDAVGLVGSCSAEMREVRRQEGGPPDHRNSDRVGTDFTEVWVFFGSPERAYTFRWGISYESCSVIGPEPLRALVPLEGPLASGSMHKAPSTADTHAGSTGGR